jgi:DtxR family Mn-dependent transcriptional regulator
MEDSMSDRHEKVVPQRDTEKRLFEDEVLETVWELAEQGEVTLTDVVEELRDEGKITRMQDDGLLRIEGDNISFTGEGESRARDIVRRHRLAERLFADVLDLQDYEADACRLEHAISPEVEERICTLLGHPPLCPHGKPIPKGRCCATFTRKVKPLVQSLRDLEVGHAAHVLFITVPAMDRLAAIGLVPGARVRLQQKRPSFVIQIDETTLAIDEDIARGIYVKKPAK